MKQPRTCTHQLLMGLALLTTILAGCSTPLYKDPEVPLRVQVLAYEVTDIRNLTINLSFTNTGEKPLAKIDTVVSARAIHPPQNGSAFGEMTLGRILDYPGTYFDEGAVFNHTDILRPGESRNVSLHAYYRHGPSDIRPGDIYQIKVHASFQDDVHRWSLLHAAPCFNVDEQVVPLQWDPDCPGRLRTSGPTPAERLTADGPG